MLPPLYGGDSGMTGRRPAGKPKKRPSFGLAMFWNPPRNAGRAGWRKRGLGLPAVAAAPTA